MKWSCVVGDWEREDDGRIGSPVEKPRSFPRSIIMFRGAGTERSVRRVVERISNRDIRKRWGNRRSLLE